jgi:hypothetical protein
MSSLNHSEQKLTIAAPTPLVPRDAPRVASLKLRPENGSDRASVACGIFFSGWIEMGMPRPLSET